MVDIYRANIVDVAIDSVMIEVTGPEDKVDSLVNLLRASDQGDGPDRRVAMMRGVVGAVRAPDEEPEIRTRSGPDSRATPSPRRRSSEPSETEEFKSASQALLRRRCRPQPSEGRKIAVIGYAAGTRSLAQSEG